jgi:antitoxin component YwqK of YwqJK toxin-antitoxin module
MDLRFRGWFFQPLFLYFCSKNNPAMSLKNPILLLLFVAFFSLTSHGQTSLNMTDQKGMKQGHWIKKYPNGNIMYDGNFKDDHPVGEFKRFYETTVPSSVLIYSPDGKEAEATLFFPNGKISSKGKFINQKKEGKWQFFDENIGFLLSEETYTEGRRNGVSVSYYPDGKIAEKVNYINGVKSGEWIRYYNNGNKWIKSSYLNGKLNGKFEAWFEKGGIEFSGEYLADARNGAWTIFNADGTVRYKLQYVKGVTTDRQMDLDQSNFIDSLERNSAKFGNPEKDM